MKAHQIHIALIEDDKQQPLGIVTMENILEKIVGDIKDEHDRVTQYEFDVLSFVLKRNVLLCRALI